MVILPKRWLYVPQHLPLFFFAGPVRGCEDWRDEAYSTLEERFGGKENFVAAIPCRYDASHRLMSHQFEAFGGETARQHPWETRNLEAAGLPPHRGGHPRGCVMFWIPEQTQERAPETGPYGRDTSGEAQHWAAFLQWEPKTRVVFGASEALDTIKAFGLDIMTRRFDHALEKNGTGGPMPIYRSLKDTVDAAIKMAA